MMVWESVSRKMCYDIPVPVCNQSPCAQQGRCNQGTSPCSSTAKVPATVCPFSGKLTTYYYLYDISGFLKLFVWS